MRTPTPNSTISTLGWAVYLGVSWTWCIGMFLPVLLLRDFGPWSFAAFAIPNIVGAALMGFVLRDGLSERVVERHAIAGRVFSIVTIAFNACFGVWLVLGPLAARWSLAAAIVFVGVMWLMSMRPRAPLVAALCVWLLSLICAHQLWQFGALDAPRFFAQTPLVGSSAPPGNLAALAPVLLLGFLLCPYLDLTFHRARQALSAGASRWAFALGFGVVFASMIALTPLYAWLFLAPNDSGGSTVSMAMLDALGSERAAALTLAGIPLVVHLCAQLCFTIFAHAHQLDDAGGLRSSTPDPNVADTDPRAASGDEARAIAPTPPRQRPRPWELGVLLLVLSAVAVVVFSPVLTPLADIRFAPAEVVYRLFMAFYGLVAPAYVLICVIPYRRAAPVASLPASTGADLTRAKLWCCAAAIILAAPIYTGGFLFDVTWMLPVGVGVILAGRGVARLLT